MPHCQKWTAEEDIIIQTKPPKIAAAEIDRTVHSVVTRRFKLRHPERKAETKARWSSEECNRLVREYPIAQYTRDLLSIFPHYSLEQIRSKARVLRLKKKFLGTDKVLIAGHQELIDQIRLRAKQDGIAFYKLDRILRTGSYFSFNAHRRKANIFAVAKAVEFFGGSLVIDWQDR